MSYRKYILLPKRKDGLCQVKYKIDIPKYSIKVGDLGGFLEGYHNLSQDGDCVVLGEAQVFGNALVSGDALVSGNAWKISPLVIPLREYGDKLARNKKLTDQQTQQYHDAIDYTEKWVQHQINAGLCK